MKTKIRINRGQVVKLLSPLNNLIQDKPMIPQLVNYLIRYSPVCTTVLASSIYATLEVEIPCETEDTGEILIPAKIVFQTLAGLSVEFVDIELDEHSITVIAKNEQATIGFKKGEYKTATDTADRFPLIKEVNYQFTTIPCSELLSGLSNTMKFANNQNDMREAMRGVCVHNNGTIKFIATDGISMAVYTSECEASNDGEMYIVNLGHIPTLLNILSIDASANCSVYIDSDFVRFHTNGYDYKCRLIDAKFPNYQGVLPSGKPTTTVEVNLPTFGKALKRISAFSEDEGGVLVLKEDSMEITSIGAGDTAKEIIPCTVVGNKLKIGINLTLMAKLVRSLSEPTATFSFDGAQKPITVTENSHFYLAMPRAI
jgi:DNA polymerase-3 subunit beta